MALCASHSPAGRRFAGALVILSSLATDALAAARGSEVKRALPHFSTNDHEIHFAGNIGFTVTNLGLLGSFPGSLFPWSSGPSAEWPKNSGTEYLWGMGLWVGALKNLIPAVTTGAFPLEFRPGNTELDVIYAAQEGDLGGHRYPSPNADDDSDNAIDEDWLDGRDNDGDGAIDEDFAAVSNEMFFCEYNDTDPSIKQANPDHETLTLLVQQQTMVWQDPLRDDIVGLSYRFINTGFDVLINTYVAFLADFDIGQRGAPNIASDDRAGFWEGIVTARTGQELRNLKLSIAYMFDSDGDAGAAEGYVGLVFLGARHSSTNLDVGVGNFRMFAGPASYPLGGDPTNDEERYETLEGTDPSPLPPPDPGTGLRPSIVSATSNDYRVLLSVGPIQALEARDSLEVDFALVVGPGFDGMIEHATQARLLYDGVWFDRDGDPNTGVDGREHQVRWYVDVPTPVTLEEFRATTRGTAVTLSWSLSTSALNNVTDVEVLRAESPSGPFESVTRAQAAEHASFEDVDVDPGRAYWYRLRLVFADGTAQHTRVVRVEAPRGAPSPAQLAVTQTNGDVVEIDYRIATAPVDVRLRVFDVAGREVRSWNEGVRERGAHRIAWDRTSRAGQRVARGTYLVQLLAGREKLTRKLVIVQP